MVVKTIRLGSEDAVELRLQLPERVAQGAGQSSEVSIATDAKLIGGTSGLAADVVANANTGNNELAITLQGHQCAENSTTEQLEADEVFTGSGWQDTIDYGVLSVNIVTDQNSATDGLDVQWSDDGISVVDHDYFTITANIAKTFTFGPAKRYYRLKYTNGSGGTTTTLSLISILRRVYVKPSSHRINDSIIGQDDAELVKAVLTGFAPDGTFKNVQVTNAGNQKSSIEEYDLSAFPSVDADHLIRDAINRISGDYSDTVSVQSKAKSLLKFGRRVTAGTGWETLMTLQGTETAETLLSTNGITTVVSSSGSDTGTVNLEYHTISGGNLTFGVQEVTLTGTTPVVLGTACARANRMYNTGASALVGNIYVYEGGSRTDANTHLVIPAGEQQTQKAATSISSTDYWIITDMTVSVSAFTTKFASARLESKPISQSYWRPFTQDISVTNDSGLTHLTFEPHRIVPKNYDVRMAVKTNSSGVSVAGGFNGFLAEVVV